MEMIVVIGILTLAGVYVARVYYLKFRQGGSYESGSVCTGCGCSASCAPRRMDGGRPPAMIAESMAHPFDLETKNTFEETRILNEGCKCRQSEQD